MLTAKLKKAMVQAKKGGQAVRENVPDKQTVFRYMLVAVVCFLLTRITLLGFLNGFGMVAAAAVPLPFSVVGLIGCTFGEFFDGLDGESLFYLLFLVGWIGGKRILQMTALPKHYMGVFWQTGILGSILLFKEMLTYFMTDGSLMDFFRGIVCVVLQLVVFIAADILATAFCVGKPMEEYSHAQGIAAVIFLILLTASLGRYQFGGFSLAQIISVLITLICAYRFGAIGGAIGGILSGFGLWLYDTSILESAGIMMLGGCLAGIIAPRGKIYTAVGMMVSHYLLVLIHAKPLLMMPLSLCTMIGVAAFLCIPQSWLERVILPQILFSHGPPGQIDSINRRLEYRMQMRMQFAADAMQMLSESVTELADVLKKEVRPDLEQVYAQVERQLCRNCKRRFSCYGADYDRTRESFDSLGSMLRCQVAINEESFPEFLRENCVRVQDLNRTFTAAYRQLGQLSAQQRQTNRTRTLVLEQYEATAQLLKDLSVDILFHPDAACEDLLTEQLSKEGYAPKQICCQRDEQDRLFVDLYYQGSTPPAGELAELLEHHVGVFFDKPVTADARNLTRISFFEPPSFGVQLGVTQKASGSNQFNGDTVTSFYDGRGNFYLLLSDGMGRGKRAALDSMTVCTILKKLITAGFGWKAALKLLNTSLMVKSAEETLATVDIIKVDLYQGEAEFIKAGAASSFFAGEKSVSRIRSFTLPIGIVSNINFDSKRIKAQAGNIMLLLSDGVEEEDGWIAKQLVSGNYANMKELTNQICTQAVKHNESERDDITAAAVRLVQLSAV